MPVAGAGASRRVSDREPASMVLIFDGGAPGDGVRSSSSGECLIRHRNKSSFIPRPTECPFQRRQRLAEGPGERVVALARANHGQKIRGLHRLPPTAPSSCSARTPLGGDLQIGGLYRRGFFWSPIAQPTPGREATESAEPVGESAVQCRAKLPGLLGTSDCTSHGEPQPGNMPDGRWTVPARDGKEMHRAVHETIRLGCRFPGTRAAFCPRGGQGHHHARPSSRPRVAHTGRTGQGELVMNYCKF